MTNTAKIWTVVVVVVILALVVWMLWGGSSPGAAEPSPTPTVGSDNTTVGTSTMNDVDRSGGLSTSMSDNSDEALARDMESVNRETKDLNDYNKGVDDSMSNPPSSPTAGL